VLIREYIAALARSFEGCPYLWGGAYPWPGETAEYGGLDCSGLVIRVLRPFRLLPDKGDWTAEGLSHLFAETVNPEPGDLGFYGGPGGMNHVAIFLGEGLAISASGGSSGTLSYEIAKKTGARVKVHRVDYRRDLRGYRNVLSPRRVQ